MANGLTVDLRNGPRGRWQRSAHFSSHERAKDYARRWARNGIPARIRYQGTQTIIVEFVPDYGD